MLYFKNYDSSILKKNVIISLLLVFAPTVYLSFLIYPNSPSLLYNLIIPLMLSPMALFAYTLNAQKLFIKNFKSLFLNLADNPYEIRVEKVKKEKNKLKVIIEENILLDNNHIIKEKSKHITGYVNLKASGDSIINLIIKLVKESEKKFQG